MSKEFLYKNLKDNELKKILKEQVIILNTHQEELEKSVIREEKFQKYKENIDCIMKNSLKELWDRYNYQRIANDVSETDLKELDEIRRTKQLI